MALMEEAEQRGQESSAPAWKINHRRGAGGKDGRTDRGEGQQAAGLRVSHPLKGRTCSTRIRAGAGAGMLLTYHTTAQVIFIQHFGNEWTHLRNTRQLLCVFPKT